MPSESFVDNAKEIHDYLILGKENLGLVSFATKILVKSLGIPATIDKLLASYPAELTEDSAKEWLASGVTDARKLLGYMNMAKGFMNQENYNDLQEWVDWMEKEFPN